MFGKIIVYIFVVFVSLKAYDYSALQAKKAQLKYESQLTQKDGVNPFARYFVIDFYDINKMDTWKLEERYSLQLHLCIADGICVFRYLHADTIPLDIATILHDETNIKKIYEYKNYNFQAY